MAELRRYLDHLRALRSRVPDAASLQRNLSLRHDVLFSLLAVCQLVGEVAGDLVILRGDAIDDRPATVHLLAGDARVPEYLLRRIERLSTLRDGITSECVTPDLDRAFQALDELDDVREFMHLVAELERGSPAA